MWGTVAFARFLHWSCGTIACGTIAGYHRWYRIIVVHVSARWNIMAAHTGIMVSWYRPPRCPPQISNPPSHFLPSFHQCCSWIRAGSVLHWHLTSPQWCNAMQCNAMQCNAELHGFELVDNPGLIFYAPHHSAISRELHNPILHSYELIALTSTTAPTLHPKTSNNILLNCTVQYNNNILKVYFVYEGF